MLDIPTASACPDAAVPLYDPSASTTAAPGALSCGAGAGDSSATPCRNIPLALANGSSTETCGCSLSYAQGAKTYQIAALEDVVQLAGAQPAATFQTSIAAVE